MVCAGRDGVDGLAGTTGRTVVDGREGATGFDGAEGLAGAEGRAGVDGRVGVAGAEGFCDPAPGRTLFVGGVELEAPGRTALPPDAAPCPGRTFPLGFEGVATALPFPRPGRCPETDCPVAAAFLPPLAEFCASTPGTVRRPPIKAITMLTNIFFMTIGGD